MKKLAKSFYKNVLPIILSLFTVTFLTVISMLYAEGYRLSIVDFNNGSGSPVPSIEVKKTGILAVRSIPDAAKIYINDKLYDTTNATIASLQPGEYTLRVEKEGFEPWEKQIQVYEDLVTDITALLILRGGGLNPITNTGVEKFSVSQNGELLAFTTTGDEKPGLYTIALSGSPLNIFQASKKAVALDKPLFIYSQAKEINWSPDNDEILVTIDENRHYLVDLNKPVNQDPLIVNDTSETFIKWQQQQLKDKQSAVESLKIPQEYANLATSERAVWSPDGEKFFIVKNTSGDEYQVSVYNFEDPLPVGESQVNNGVVYTGDDTKVTWYSDSKHLVLAGGQSLKVVNIDGSNNVEVFSGEVIDSKAISSPAGDKIIILSKFKSDAPANLYAVSIR